MRTCGLLPGASPLRRRNPDLLVEPLQGLVGRCLRATATYADSRGGAHDHETRLLEVPVRYDHVADTDQQLDGGFVNVAPVSPDQDPSTEEEQSDNASRSVAENTAGASERPPAVDRATGISLSPRRSAWPRVLRRCRPFEAGLRGRPALRPSRHPARLSCPRP